ncbi:LysR family transcriptional regulator [Burkholderia ubonensis]|uniref:LysR family transcriptional regulator n=1 Tax=Burkholderia ubonensis TaxID=101571 RepID=UPI000759EE12|nr:LysR family transcriptional regulator [Burkholderia ubonensis]KVC65489.1 LysR family transcriptional regulator [Burkholderia ubonensis]KVD94554.1 LysR family transcriptional regulator [Burkholderia ubonensis]
MISLDVDAVRTFLLVADFESFTKAADYLDTTQGVVSVKVKRLEERLGFRLLDRNPRSVRLSREGGAFIEAAREFIEAHDRALRRPACPPARLSLGVTHHLVDSKLPALLSTLHTYDPELTIEVHVSGSRRLLDELDNRNLDAAIVRRVEGRSDGQVITNEQLGWYAAPGWKYVPGTPLRLASLSATCRIRSMAVRALDEAGITWVEVFVGGSVNAVAAAASAGLAVAVLARAVVPAGSVEVGARYGLPSLRGTDFVLHSGHAIDERAKGALRMIVASYSGNPPVFDGVQK